jgi:DNA polymerase-3 subunit gamma/tau
MSESYYQKYRPIQLTDVVGQDAIVRAITKAAEKEAFNHAYLFAGSFGSGKTTMARILATLLTCSARKPNTSKVCGKCRSCVGIHHGHCTDVTELDGASNRGIDDIRDLKKTAHYSPQELVRKVYILDEVHKLTSDACSSLLKIVEEPPPYVVFILCTTDARKILPTITSRCQRYNFSQIATPAMAERVCKVAEREGIQIDAEAAKTICRMSHGSLRDALSFLEQIAMSNDKKIVAATASGYFGSPEQRITHEIVNLIADKNESGLLYKVNEISAAGVDPKTILVEVSKVLRDILLVRSCGADTTLVDLDAEERRAVAELSGKLTTRAIVRMTNVFSKIDKEIAVNINERLILEAALINCIFIANDETKPSGQS